MARIVQARFSDLTRAVVAHDAFDHSLNEAQVQAVLEIALRCLGMAALGAAVEIPCTAEHRLRCFVINAAGDAV